MLDTPGRACIVGLQPIPDQPAGKNRNLWDQWWHGPTNRVRRKHPRQPRISTPNDVPCVGPPVAAVSYPPLPPATSPTTAGIPASQACERENSLAAGPSKTPVLTSLEDPRKVQSRKTLRATRKRCSVNTPWPDVKGGCCQDPGVLGAAAGRRGCLPSPTKLAPLMGQPGGSPICSHSPSAVNRLHPSC